MSSSAPGPVSDRARHGRTRTRGRHSNAVLHGTAVALVGTAMAVLVAGIALNPAPPAPAAWASVSVGDSGTLWQLAQQHSVPGLSTAETVELIRLENGLASSIVYAGQTLRVPATSNAAAVVAQR